MDHSPSTFTPVHRARALKLGIAATAALYLLTAFIAEPMRGLAGDSENVIVQVTVADVIALACDGTDAGPNVGSGQVVSLGTITVSGDTGAYADSRAAVCYMKTSSNNGADFGWYIWRGSGGTKTGYLINPQEQSIEPHGTGSGNAPRTWTVASNESRWGARVSSTSSGSAVGIYDFGTDASSEKWSRVKTGATVAIRRVSVASTAGSGAVIKIGFRAQVGTLKNQASGVYETPYATGTGGVIFTANSL
jgi:hypothetical protein